MNRGEAKRAEMVKLAFDRFYDGGFHATGVDAVLADSGISKRTLYKHFASKEDLIEAVLNHYGEEMRRDLFDPAAASNADPRTLILSLFDRRKAMMDEHPARGCLCVRAAQDYLGKDAKLADFGKRAALLVENTVAALCGRAGFAKSEELGRQINLLFQSAMLLSQVYGDSTPFDTARQAVVVLLDCAQVDPAVDGSRALARQAEKT